MASVQIVVFVVLSSLARKFQSEALVGDLVHPDARHHGHRSLVGASLITRLCCCRSLTAELPAGIDELVQRVSRFEHEDCVELLDSKTQARLDLEHLHVSNLLRLVVEDNTLAFSPACEQDLHAGLAERPITGRRLDRSPGGAAGL